MYGDARSVWKKMVGRLALQLADEELCLGHRDSEWLGLAPDVEEDVAFSSIAQDEVRHAAFWYEIAEEMGFGQADALAFDRPAEERLNAAIAARPNGDWAHTVLRHFLYDAWDAVRLSALADGQAEKLAHGARRMLREEHYHHLHMERWVIDLGRAGGEAYERLNAALTALLADLPDLLSFAADAQALVDLGVIAMGLPALRDAWLARIEPVLREAGLPFDRVRAEAATAPSRRQPKPGADLAELLAAMNGVRQLGAAVW